MFYPAVEEYVMQNRQRELAKDLEIRRQMRNSLESKSDDGPHFFAEAGGRLRNLVRLFKMDTNASFYSETPLDCVTC